jgi:hypothetical protein
VKGVEHLSQHPVLAASDDRGLRRCDVIRRSESRHLREPCRRSAHEVVEHLGAGSSGAHLGHGLEHGQVRLAAASMLDALSDTDDVLFSLELGPQAIGERGLTDAGAAGDEHEPALPLARRGDVRRS